MDGREIELKLGMDPQGLERLRRHRVVKSAAQGRAISRRLESVYFDTDGLALSRAGVSLRVRTVGGRRVQTVKTAGARASGLFSRQEWEAPLMAAVPDPVALRATGLALFQDNAVTGRLAPLFATRVRRTLYRLAGEGWEVELALDRGEVEAGARCEPFCEVELELRRGDPEHLFQLARAITEAVPTARLMAISKSDRGYMLAAGTSPAPMKSRPVALAPDMSVGQAFQAIARNCLDHLLANEHSLLTSRDPEAIHQMRVALRRFRSALKVFRDVVEGPQLAQAREEVRWLLERLGPARDSEVFLEEIVEPVARRFPGHPGIAALAARWGGERDRAFEAAVASVTDQRFTALVLDLGAWVENGDWRTAPELAERPILSEPVGAFADRVLARRDRKMLKAGGADLVSLPPDALHQVRILGKQMRYAGEFFHPLYGRKSVRPLLDALTELQDVLGEINDIAVAGPRLEAGAGKSADEHWAAGVIAGWHDARRPDLLVRAAECWKVYRTRKRFWRRGQ